MADGHVYNFVHITQSDTEVSDVLYFVPGAAGPVSDGYTLNDVKQAVAFVARPTGDFGVSFYNAGPVASGVGNTMLVTSIDLSGF